MLSPEVRGRQLRRPIERSAGHQRLDAFVRISQPFLEPDDRLAARMKTKMPRLYNASMHRADRNLMQPLSLGRQESVRRNGGGRSGSARQAVRGPAIVHGPATAADRARRPAHSRTDPVSPAPGGSLGDDKRPTDGNFPPSQAQAGDRELAPASIQQRHMDRAGIAPESGEGQKAIAKLTPKVAPQIARQPYGAAKVGSHAQHAAPDEGIGQGQA